MVKFKAKKDSGKKVLTLSKSSLDLTMQLNMDAPIAALDMKNCQYRFQGPWVCWFKVYPKAIAHKTSRLFASC